MCVLTRVTGLLNFLFLLFLLKMERCLYRSLAAVRFECGIDISCSFSLVQLEFLFYITFIECYLQKYVRHRF